MQVNRQSNERLHLSLRGNKMDTCMVKNECLVKLVRIGFPVCSPMRSGYNNRNLITVIFVPDLL